MTPNTAEYFAEHSWMASASPNTPRCWTLSDAVYFAEHSWTPDTMDAEYYAEYSWMSVASPNTPGCRTLSDAEHLLPSTSCLVKSPGNTCPPKCIAWPNMMRFESGIIHLGGTFSRMLAKVVQDERGWDAERYVRSRTYLACRTSLRQNAEHSGIDRLYRV